MRIHESYLQDRVGIVRLSGAIDLTSAPELRGVLDDAIERGAERIVLDVAEVDFIDSSGLAVIALVAERLGNVELRHPIAIVRRIIEVTGLSAIIEVSE